MGVLALVVADHGNINYAGPGDRFFDLLFYSGQLTMGLLCLGTLAATVLEIRILSGVRRSGDYFPSLARQRWPKLSSLRTPEGWIEWRAFRLYERARRAVYLARWRWRFEPAAPEEVKPELATLALYGTLVGVWSDSESSRGTDGPR